MLTEFEVFDIPPELLGEGQAIPEQAEAATQSHSGLTSTPADRRRRRAEETVMLALLAFAEAEPDLAWPESTRRLNL